MKILKVAIMFKTPPPANSVIKVYKRKQNGKKVINRDIC